MQMFQSPLIEASEANKKTVYVEGITAVITQYGDRDYEVLLEINSNKILVALQGAYDSIEELQVLAVKGFVELSKSFLITIKKLIGHLLCRLD